MANIDNVQLPDGSSYNIVDNTSGFATQNYVNSAVSSVTKTTIGLGNVDNTSDLSKPISTATQTALNTLDEDKADKTDIAPVESSSTASASHATGSQFYFNGQLVTATADINAGGTITLNGNCTPSESVTEQIKNIGNITIKTGTKTGTPSSSGNIATDISASHVCILGSVLTSAHSDTVKITSLQDTSNNYWFNLTKYDGTAYAPTSATIKYYYIEY